MILTCLERKNVEVLNTEKEERETNKKRKRKNKQKKIEPVRVEAVISFVEGEVRLENFVRHPAVIVCIKHKNVHRPEPVVVQDVTVTSKNVDFFIIKDCGVIGSLRPAGDASRPGGTLPCLKSRKSALAFVCVRFFSLQIVVRRTSLQDLSSLVVTRRTLCKIIFID